MARTRAGRRVRHHVHVPLSRIAWLVTVAVCLFAAVVLVLSNYFGYAVVLTAIAASAAINLR